LLLGSFPVFAAAPTPTFGDRHEYSGCLGVTAQPVLAAADFNGDGVPDLLCSGQGLLLFLGNGDGSFGPSTTLLPLGGGNAGVANPLPVDMNGDGINDIVSTGTPGGGSGTYGIVVTLGNGDGTFQPGTLYPVTGNYQSVNFIVSGDFNGDGIPDIASEGSSGIWLFTGAGKGLLNPGVLIPVSIPGLSGLAAADVNGDGKLDLVADTGTGFGVFLGNGDGTFQPEIDTAVPFDLNGFAVGDLNGDGLPDVITVSSQEAFGLVYVGNGNGTFAAGKKVNLGAESASVAIGDVNGDGYPDIVTAAGEVAYGNGKGGFSAPKSYVIAGSGVYVGAAQLTRNGRTDFLFQDFESPASVLVSTEEGGFQEGESVPVAGGGAGCGVAADFNGDGIPDVAVLVAKASRSCSVPGRRRRPTPRARSFPFQPPAVRWWAT